MVSRRKGDNLCQPLRFFLLSLKGAKHELEQDEVCGVNVFGLNLLC